VLIKIITLDRDDVVCRAGDRLVVNGEDGKAQARIVSSKIGRKSQSQWRLTLLLLKMFGSLMLKI
jgi:hypothetical protein